MSAVLLSALSYAREAENAKALYSSHSQTASYIMRNPSNTTISCILSGIEYFISSPSFHTINCESIIHDATALTANASVDGRSVINIIWSCLATIFACTWVSLHPNIPYSDATEWQIRRHRFFMMVCGLIAPEVIVLVALRQWFGARVLVREMKKRNFVVGFTMVHGHFMQMGGFTLYSVQGRCLGVTKDPMQLSRAIQVHGWILPTTEEIMDKSKGDNLSKALAVGQTGWFIVQSVSRLTTGLAISQIEVVTLALAAVNGVIYFLWWNKPLNVRYPVRVNYGEQVRRPGSPAITFTPTSDFDAGPSTPDSASMVFSTHDTRSELDYGDDVRNLRQWILRPPVGWLWTCFSLLLPRSSGIFHSSCEPEDTPTATGVAAVVAVLFGSVHCLAWDFQFLTPQERTLWRVWSIIITAMPCALCMRHVLSNIARRSIRGYIRQSRPRSWTHNFLVMRILCPLSWTSMMISLGFMPVYVIGRVGLLVQAVIALRALQPLERAEVKWVSLLPHL